MKKYSILLEELIELVDEKYVFISNQNIKWNLNLAKVKAQIIYCNSDRYCFQLFQNLLSSLGDIHTNIKYKDLSELIPNINCLWENSNLIVVDSLNKYGKDILYGSIKKINNKDIQSIILKYQKKYSGYSLAVIKSLIIQDIRTNKMVENDVIKLDIEKNNQHIEFNTNYIAQSDIIAQIKKMPSLNNLPIVDKYINTKTKYIKLFSFFSKDIDDFICSIVEENIIIDVRNNPGGYIDNAIKILSSMVTRNIILENINVYNGCDLRKIEIIMNGKRIINNKRIIVLCNENTMSCAEYLFVNVLSNFDNVTIVGKTTAGVSGQAKTYNISDKATLSLTVKKYLDRYLNEIKDGIIPDHIIENDYDEEMNIIDNQLDYCVSLCKKGD